MCRRECRASVLLLSWITGAVIVTGCIPEDPFPTLTEETTLAELTFPSLPGNDTTNRYLHDPRARALGAQLFEDASLSSCGTVSCKSCHLPEEGFSYRAGPGAPGCDGGSTSRNPPTLLNVAYSQWFMWDGRADRLWSQAILPFLSPAEMNGSPTQLRQKLSAEPYGAAYADLFGASAELHSEDQVLANFGKALQAFEWTLTSTTSPFDREVDAYLEAVREGTQETHPLHLALKTFVRKGTCTQCHKGGTLTDEDFHNVGVADATPGRVGRIAGIPQLLEFRFNAVSTFSDKNSGSDAYAANRIANLRLNFNNQAEVDRLEALGQMTGAFKTPTLRNIALTAPYMHTGVEATLADVVEFYNRGGDPADSFAGTRATAIKPLELTVEEKAALVHLLELMSADE